MVDEIEQKPVEVKLDLSSEPTLLEQTKQIVADLKAQNDRKEALILREEKERANAMLSGRSFSNPQTLIDPKLEKKIRAKEYFKGSEVEKAIEKYG